MIQLRNRAQASLEAERLPLNSGRPSEQVRNETVQRLNGWMRKDRRKRKGKREEKKEEDWSEEESGVQGLAAGEGEGTVPAAPDQ